MKKNVDFLCPVLALLLIACNSPDTGGSKNETDSTETADVRTSESSCFAWTTPDDTILLKIEVLPNVVTGVLKYNISGKDRNDGTIAGHLHGSKIIADYTFVSEGKQSVRQVAFLLKGNTAMEGYADMEEKDGKMVFKDTSKIDFSSGTKLDKIPCVDNDDKFRSAGAAEPSEK